MKNLKEIGEILITKGADINAKTIIFQTIELLFSIKIMQNIVRKLNMKNNTPLHYAVKNQSKEMVELLITKGADINAKDIICLIIIFITIKLFNIIL